MYRVHYGEAYWRRPEVFLMKNDIKLFFISMRRVFFFPFSLFLFFFWRNVGVYLRVHVLYVQYHIMLTLFAFPHLRDARTEMSRLESPRRVPPAAPCLFVRVRESSQRCEKDVVSCDNIAQLVSMLP